MTRRNLIQSLFALPILSWLAPKSEAKELIPSNVPSLDRVLGGGFPRGMVTEISNCQCSNLWLNWYNPYQTTSSHIEFFDGQYGTPYVSAWRNPSMTSDEVYAHCRKSLQLGKAVVFITSRTPMLTNEVFFVYENTQHHALADVYLVCDDPHDSSLRNAAVYRRS